MFSPFDPQTLPYHNPKTGRRTALITAGNSGVGWYTVLHLYLHGYVVYLAGRLRLRCRALISALEKRAARIRATYSPEVTKMRPVGELHFLELDLALLSSVLAAVRALGNLEKHLNLLVNNAGVLAPPTETVDGFDLQLQTLYVAPFLLTTRLLPLLERGGRTAPESPSRVIYVSSVAHQMLLVPCSPGRRLWWRPNFFFSWVRYAVAKTAGIHFVQMLALRNPRLVCLSVDPGLVMNTNYFSYWTRLPIIGIMFWCLFQIIGFLFGVSAEQAAHTLLYSSLDPTIGQRESGAHFSGRRKARPSRVARNMDLAARSWIWTTHQLAKRNIEVD